MGQILRNDKIGALSHSGGIITMAASSSNPAWLTVGGQQYKITSNLTRTISSDVTLAANSLYMIYVVRNAGNTELRISTNFNSVGPTGFLSWKLLGAFYANGAVTPAFGSFVTIEGVPESNPFYAGTGRLFIGGTEVSNKGVVTIDEVHIYRKGATMHIEWRFQKDSTGQALSGAYEVAPPKFGPGLASVYQIDESRIASLVGINLIRTMGIGWWGNAGIAYDVFANYVGGNVLQFAKSDGANTSMNTTTVNWTGQTIHYYGFTAEFPVSQWNVTPLKDL